MLKYACLRDSCNTLFTEKWENYDTLGTFCERITVTLALTIIKTFQIMKLKKKRLKMNGIGK